MGTPRTGTLEPAWTDKDGRTRYTAKIRLGDGTRFRRHVPLEKCVSKEKAKGWAEWLQEQEDANGAILAAKIAERAAETGVSPSSEGGETVAQYAKRWLLARKGRVRRLRDNRAHLEHHVLPVLGPLLMARVARPDVERFVDALDAKVRKGELGAKSAKNIWGTCSKLFDDATNAKPAEGLRCLPTDPTDGVRGPDDNHADKLLQFLYPSELQTFLACEAVPLSWRRNAAIAIYLCVRDGEQRALKWPAVDLTHGVVTIQETYDRDTEADREGTKGGAARMVHVRPELLPLLKAMHAEAKAAMGGEHEPKGHVCKLHSHHDMARGIRTWLWNAGVRRDQLHVGSSVNKQLRWHDLRATGATWLAVEGRSATEIRDVLGHTQTSMTDRYMRSASVLRGGAFGRPFPPLPTSLVVGVERSSERSKSRRAIGQPAMTVAEFLRRGRDSNPRSGFIPTPA